jgi:hypothetical protein
MKEAPMLVRMFLAMLCFGVLAAGCSRSNNLLFGRVEAIVAGHTVVVTDCYRTRVPPPVQEPNGATFIPCRDAVVAIRNEQLSVNGTAYGPLARDARVLVDHGRVSVEKP